MATRWLCGYLVLATSSSFILLETSGFTEI